MEKIELIIFDMDGLMFDTERIGFLAWKGAAAAYGYRIDEQLYGQVVGVNSRRTGEIYRNHFGSGFPLAAVRDKRYAIAEDLIKQQGVPVKEGLYELLDYLAGTGWKRAVATSTSRGRATALLNLAGVSRYFDYVLCGDQIEHSKPHPEIFLTVAEKMDCLPERCVVLEDSPVGIEAAHRAGMLPLLVPDLLEPGEEVAQLAYKRFPSLHQVREFLAGQ